MGINLHQPSFDRYTDGCSQLETQKKKNVRLRSSLFHGSFIDELHSYIPGDKLEITEIQSIISDEGKTHI